MYIYTHTFIHIYVYEYIYICIIVSVGRIGMLKIVYCMHIKLHDLVTFETMPLTTYTQVTYLPVVISSTNTTIPQPLILLKHTGTGRGLKKWELWK